MDTPRSTSRRRSSAADDATGGVGATSAIGAGSSTTGTSSGISGTGASVEGSSAAGSSGTGSSAQERGGGIAGKVKERAVAGLASQKNRATDGIGTVAHAVRQTGERLREEQKDTMAQYVEKAAEQLERLSTNLRDRDVGELLEDAQRLARRQPALFIGGSFALGLLAARFLKSSPEREYGEYRSGMSMEHGYDEYRTAGRY